MIQNFILPTARWSFQAFTFLLVHSWFEEKVSVKKSHLENFNMKN